MSHDTPLESLNLDDLIAMATRLDLIDSAERSGQSVKIRLARLHLDFSESQAAMYLRALLRGNAQAAHA